MYNSTDDDYVDSNFVSNSSGSVNIISNCCGLFISSAVPLSLIICGAILTGKPTTETINNVKLFYLIFGSLMMLNNVCCLAIGCLSHCSLCKTKKKLYFFLNLNFNG